MGSLFAHLPQTFIVLGLVLLAIDILVLGFSTFFLLFLGIGTIVTGLLMTIGLIPETVLHSLSSTAIISTFVALLGWKRIKNLQNKVKSNPISNDMIGHRFVLTENLTPGQTLIHRYSGVDWQVKAKDPLPAGTEVKIIAMEVGLLTVERVN
ncbi:MAG: NfeD family protein [Psychromonas sp.]|nr:NfeD family protein [Psychromonas sp.]